MNPIAFEEISDKRKRELYKSMWGSDAFDFQVEKTVYKGEPSLNSYTFANPSAADDDICARRLMEQFQIQDRERFRAKFDQSCGGSGGEGSRIATLHSSALCALLFFYRVSKAYPCIIPLDGENYTFTDSCFEYQNAVIEGRGPSNIDVALLEERGKAVLFLESKFAEYYLSSGITSDKISEDYRGKKCKYGKRVYEDQGLGEMGLTIESRGSKKFVLRAQESCYPDGLKQMISHYIGVRNRVDDPFREPQGGSSKTQARKEADTLIANAIAKGAKVFLGEILFPLPLPEEDKRLSAYEEKYRALADILNQQLRDDKMDGRITVLREPLSYERFRRRADDPKDRIQRFYFGSEQE